MFEIEMLPANEGDALWIRYGSKAKPRHVLIDGGRKASYREAMERLDGVQLELFVLTHVDEDHIFGAMQLLADDRFTKDRVGDIWFNGWCHLEGRTAPPRDQLGARQGEYFAAKLLDKGMPWNEEFTRAPIVVPRTGKLHRAELAGELALTVVSPTHEKLEAMRADWIAQLSKDDGTDKEMVPGDYERALQLFAEDRRIQPDRMGAKDWLEEWKERSFDAYASADLEEDTKAPNGSSIALVADHDGRRVLLTGDAHPSVLVEGLRRYKRDQGIAGARIPFDAIKLSHHGSRNNISDDLLALVTCRRWLVSTDGSRHHHPSPETVARVIRSTRNAELYFNYDKPETAVWKSEALQSAHGYTAHYGKDGTLLVTLD